MNCCSNTYINNCYQHRSMDIPAAYTQTLDDLARAFPYLEFKPDCPESPDFYRGLDRDQPGILEGGTQRMVVSYEFKPIPLIHVRVYERQQAQQVADIMRARGLGPIIRDQLDLGKIDVDAWL